MPNVLAIDMGSSSIRAYLGNWDNQKQILQLSEVYRRNIEVNSAPDGTLTWPVSVFVKIVLDIARAAADVLGGPPDSVGVDGWGVDFVRINSEGLYEEYPRAYRDKSGHIGQMYLDQKISQIDQYRLTGVLPQNINSVNRLFQTSSNKKSSCTSIMFLQDMIARVLATKEIPGWDDPVECAPWASLGVASTSALVDVNRWDWNDKMISAAGIQRQILPSLRGEPSLVAQRGKTKICLSGSHDTACAAYAIAPEVGDIFVSCGSWAVVGAITAYPVTTDKAYDAGVTNEMATGGANRAELNQTGLWLVQECRRQWEKEGLDISYGYLGRIMQEAQSIGIVIDTSDPELSTPGNMPHKIRGILKRDYGVNDCNNGQLLRLIDESLAVSIANSVRILRDITESKGTVRITGGGAKDDFLMQQIANVLGQEIRSANCEASIIGNIFAQLHLLGIPKGATKAWFENAYFSTSIMPNAR